MAKVLFALIAVRCLGAAPVAGQQRFSLDHLRRLVGVDRISRSRLRKQFLQRQSQRCAPSTTLPAVCEAGMRNGSVKEPTLFSSRPTWPLSFRPRPQRIAH